MQLALLPRLPVQLGLVPQAPPSWPAAGPPSMHLPLLVSHFLSVEQPVVTPFLMVHAGMHDFRPLASAEQRKPLRQPLSSAQPFRQTLEPPNELQLDASGHGALLSPP